jgi:hypothetical protein
MTFTYDTSNANGQIRLEIGDFSDGEGIRPNGDNFTDEEIAYLYGEEGSHVLKTVARLCEVLSREYSAYAGIQMLDGHAEGYNRMAENFAKRAADIRARYGGDFGTDTDSTLVQVTPTRVDGFSQDIDASEV